MHPDEHLLVILIIADSKCLRIAIGGFVTGINDGVQITTTCTIWSTCLAMLFRCFRTFRNRLESAKYMGMGMGMGTIALFILNTVYLV